jgi:phospholipid/cholesterol/gamma-HCH transport system substrate-binding protein
MKLNRETKIGIFGVLMLLLFYFGFNYLKGQDVFSRSETYYTTYKQANGIAKSAAIMMKGFRVGTVSGMTLNQNSETAPIVLELTVKSKYKIPRDSKARIFSGDLLSGKALAIDLGSSNEYLEPGDTLFSEVDPDLLEIAGSELDALKKKASLVVNELIETLGAVDSLLCKQNLQNISKMLANVEQITAKLNESGLDQMVNNMNRFSKALGDNSHRVDSVLRNVASLSDSLVAAKLPTMVNEATRAMSQLNDAMENINNGKGTIGALMENKELYDSLVRATSNLSLLLEDLKNNPKRYVHFSLFGRKSN